MANPEHIDWLLKGAEFWNKKRSSSFFRPDFSGANLFEEFKRSGKILSEKSFSLSGYNLSIANFHGAQLFDDNRETFANFNCSNLTKSSFRDTDLAGFEFSGRFRRGVVFDDANLSYADFTCAKLGGYSFRGSNLFHTELSEADLREADLSKANLCAANLGDANMNTAKLTGTTLSGTRILTSNLFENTSNSESARDYQNRIVELKQIKNVSDLVKACHALNIDGRSLYFRGESQSNWELRPSVMRSDYNKKGEGQTLLELISQRPEDFGDSTYALDQWVRAQHHGLRTRLLDITRNPLVSLFCACAGLDEKEKNHNYSGRIHVFSVPKSLVKPFNSDTISIIANFAKLPHIEQELIIDRKMCRDSRSAGASFEDAMNKLYHLIRQEKPHFMEKIDIRDLFRVFVVEPAQSIERIRTQSGAFLISAFHERFEQEEITSIHGDIQIYSHAMIGVTREKRKIKHILDELKLLNITREKLYPGLDETAKAITDTFRI